MSVLSFDTSVGSEWQASSEGNNPLPASPLTNITKRTNELSTRRIQSPLYPRPCHARTSPAALPRRRPDLARGWTLLEDGLCWRVDFTLFTFTPATLRLQKNLFRNVQLTLYNTDSRLTSILPSTIIKSSDIEET